MYERETANALRSLGVDPTKHLPKEGAGPGLYTLAERGWFQGFQVVVFVKAKDDKDYILNNKGHRFMAKCPSCEKIVSFGRIEQHLMSHVIDKVMVRMHADGRKAEFIKREQ